MRLLALTLTLLLLTLISPAAVFGQPITQWADQLIDYSTQWTARDWSAHQTLGPSNTFSYGSVRTSWSPVPKNGTIEYVTVGFAVPVYASGAIIRETYGNGFVSKVDALDINGVLHTVWTGTDPSQPGSPVEFTLTFPRTAFAVRGLRIYVDTAHDSSTYEETDSIRLVGTPIAYPQWASRVLAFSSEWSATDWGSRQALGAPDTFGYADTRTAWTPRPQNGTTETLQLDYDTPVSATGVVVRENWGNGCVTKIELVDEQNGLHTVWQGIDPSPSTTSVNFTHLFAPTPYIVKGVRVSLDTNRNLQTWEEIDAVCLLGARLPRVSGTILPEDCADRTAPVTLEFRPLSGGETLVRTTTTGSDGTFRVNGVPPGNYLLAVKGTKWLRKTVTVTVGANPDATYSMGVVALTPGDANNDNCVDVDDLDAFIQAFDSAPGDANWNPNADFNNDGLVDVGDCALFVRHFDEEGDA